MGRKVEGSPQTKGNIAITDDFDPIDAAANGIAGYAAGEIFKNAIGVPNTGDLINLAVEKLINYVDQRLDKETILVAQAHIDGAVKMLEEVDAVQNDNDLKRALLSNLDTESLLGYSTLRKKGLQAIGPLYQAVTFRFYVAAAYLKHLGQRELAREIGHKYFDTEGGPDIGHFVGTTWSRYWFAANQIGPLETFENDGLWGWRFNDNGTPTSNGFWFSRDQAYQYGKEYRDALVKKRQAEADRCFKEVVEVYNNARAGWLAALTEFDKP
jgi:hypothetical protein